MQTPEKCSVCEKPRCTIVDDKITCGQVDSRNNTTHCHGGHLSPSPTETSWESRFNADGYPQVLTDKERYVIMLRVNEKTDRENLAVAVAMDILALTFPRIALAERRGIERALENRSDCRELYETGHYCDCCERLSALIPTDPAV